ncbi:glycosyltransferase [Sphingomonas aracearum]|uniref:Glycosyltransferase n=2 Tax=Sphingomonas aracearum TaxID=2283317 RepID=A0A369W0J7_9SPHN|nr:glycosyltransferase [Sphingomonas aracearum]
MRDAKPLVLCDLTQSYSPSGGGGISTYLREKRDYVQQHTPHTLLQIVPGPEDRVTVNGRQIFAEVASDQVKGSPNYRFILRTRAVRRLLEEYQPQTIESLCPWVLPWAAIHHRRRFPHTALIAGYRTDFPNAHVYRVAKHLFGDLIGRGFQWLSYGYTELTYREFDWVYTLSEEARAALGRRGIRHTEVLPLGVDTNVFTPEARDPAYRAGLGLPGDGPLLVYAGRIDNEKRADRLVEMMRRLPPELGASLVMIGDGKLREQLVAESADLPIAWPGFEQDRAGLARALASSDLYVSAMADETFGISVLEAQASGLPVIGVASGAMPDRVPPGLGLLGPVDDMATMADNVLQMWRSDHDGIGRAARAHVDANFSWRRTFERLLGEIYPKALASAARRQASQAGSPPVGTMLSKAG